MLFRCPPEVVVNAILASVLMGFPFPVINCPPPYFEWPRKERGYGGGETKAKLAAILEVLLTLDVAFSQQA